MMPRKRDGFSKERLKKLEKGVIASWGEAWETSLGMTDYLKETVKSSFRNRSLSKEWERGNDLKRGEKLEVEPKTYYHYLHSFHKSYTAFKYDPDSLLCLGEILEDASNHNVEVLLFFNPVSIDLLALQQICGRAEAYKKIKINVATLHKVYDFAWASPIACDREGVWLDGSHYHRPTGDRMRETMVGKGDLSICKVLDKENGERQLLEEKAQYDSWAKGNKEYVDTLSAMASEKIPDGALEKYLGF